MVEFLAVSAIAVGLVCVATAFLDMGMNGASGSAWAPYGFGIAAGCGVVIWLVLIS